jgi:GAF domain-containing protein
MDPVTEETASADLVGIIRAAFPDLHVPAAQISAAQNPANRNDVHQQLKQLIALLAGREQHRSAVIQAIRETAADIIGLQEVSQVLAVSISRAQALLGADIAYVSIYDAASGVNAVRASIGTRSPDFNSLEVPFGVGVGGIIASTKTPFVSADYLADPAISHLTPVDTGIAAEGIRAVVAVPMVVRNRVVGGIYAADRSPRVYTTDEVDIMVAFGALVAVAVENAQLFEERTRSLDTVRQAYESLSARNAGADRVDVIHRKISSLALGNGSLPDLLDTLGSDLGLQSIVFDAFSCPIVSTLDGDKFSPQAIAQLSAAARQTLRRSLKSGSAEELTLPHGEIFVCIPLRVETLDLGALVAYTPHVVHGHELRAFENASQLVSSLVLLRQQRRDAARNAQGEELRKFVVARSDGQSPLGPHISGALGNTFAVVTISVGGDENAQTRDGLRRLLHNLDGVSYEEHGAIVGVLPERGIPHLHNLADNFSMQFDTEPLTILTRGVVEFTLGDAVPRSLERLATLRAAGTTGLVSESSANENSTNGWPISTDNTRVNAFIQSNIGPLITYDAERSTALAETLRKYLDAGRNAQRVAEELSIHYKTVQQRLDRATQLLNLNWNDPQQILRAQAALHFHHP